MGVLLRASVNPSSAKDCTALPVKNFARVAKALWPKKTAMELSVRAGVSERAAKYWLSGQVKPTTRALLAIMSDLAE